MSQKYPNKQSLVGWIGYDWANSAFSTTVMAGFFPIFFKSFLAEGVSSAQSTAWLGAANAIGVLFVGLTAPILGTLSDAGGYKKRFLAGFAFLGILATAALGFIPKGGALVGAVFYGIACLGHASSFVFYDSLLPSITTKKNIDFVSASGYAWGYLGGGLLFAVNVLMFQKPDLFGISDGVSAVKLSFVSVALWWTVFSLPLFFWVREPKAENQNTGLSVLKNATRAVSEIRTTLSRIGQYKTVMIFLIAFFLYNDGVGTIIRMAVDYGMSIGLATSDLILALLIVQFIGFPSALLFGKITKFMSPRKGIFICIGIYLFAAAWAFQMDSSMEFYLLAGIIGLVQGGIQALSRSYYTRLIPEGKSGEFFGYYNLLGKFSGILGPLLIGGISVLTGSNRIGILSISLIFIGGGLVLFKVPKESLE